MDATQYRDPVHVDPDGRWYFYDETWANRYGPYGSEAESRSQMQSYANWLNSQKAPTNEPAAPSEADAEVEAYLKLRDQKAELAARHKEEMAEVDKALNLADAALLARLQTMGVESFKAAGATVHYTTEFRASIGDKSALMEYIRESGEAELLQSRVSSTVLKEWMQAHEGRTPPGVTAQQERVVRVRKN